MKKNTVIILLVFAFTQLQAQNYLINFEGIGASTTIESVEVENITQGTSLTLDGTDILNLVGILGIEDYSLDNGKGLRIYPNPMTTTYSNIDFEIQKASLVTIEIFDITGKLMTAKQSNLQTGLHSYKANQLGSGLFIVSVKTDDAFATGKIISYTTTNEIATLNYTSNSQRSQETNSRSNSGIIAMQYNDGDVLHVRGTSGDYATVSALVPTSDATVTFNFVAATDEDGNLYTTITLGSQTWMLENLKTTTFNDGELIPEYMSGDDWYNGANPTPFYQWASTLDLSDAVEGDIPFDYYGAMYNDATIASGKLAPTDWRIPSEQDFIDLESFIGNNGQSGNQGTALKSSSGWASSIGNGTDLFGFKGLPNGYVDSNGTPKVDGVICTWATSDANTTNQTRRIINLFNENPILFVDQSILLGAGIRCIKE
jgi:uncharacterized protein (TIGR02145 family)